MAENDQMPTYQDTLTTRFKHHKTKLRAYPGFLNVNTQPRDLVIPRTLMCMETFYVYLTLSVR